MKRLGRLWNARLYGRDLAPLATHAQLIDKAGQAQAIRTPYAASRLCRSQANLNYGNSLIDALLDDYSTRYDEPRDLFVVLRLTALKKPAVGIKHLRVHCHVVPEETVVSYFRGFVVEA